MFIKQIIIQGFKSYKDQTQIEPFSPGHNVIVGRNGSGKSNFFAAVRFILGDDQWDKISTQDRSQLLHEGSGSAVVTAYVEIIFDNSDDRFHTGKPEVILRRTIGMKKDEYSIDRKNASRTDVVNLLESAGFSRSNPYYIVPQGRVTMLTNMKDVERLNLLKDVAGTKIYEARRADSIKIMEETDNKRNRIDDLLRYINERLAELEEEKKELTQFQELDKEIRCLQYTLMEKEKQTVKEKLDYIDERRVAGVDETDEDRDLFVQRENEVNEIEERIRGLTQQIDILELERQQLDDDRKDKVRAKAKIELDVSNLSQGQAAAQQARIQSDNELRSVRSAIQDRQQELNKLLPEYNKQVGEEKDLAAQLESAQATQNRLRAKQGRATQFKSKKERDDFLRDQIETINMNLAQRKAISMQATEDISDLKAEIGRLETESTELRTRLENRGDDMQTVAVELDQAKEACNNLKDQRIELWREDAKMGKLLDTARKELSDAEQFLQRMTDRNTWGGIKAVRQYKEKYNMEGVYGTLGELFEVPDRYRTAVEVTAGQSLFHYVVDNEETGGQLIKMLQKDKKGRITFMPLSKLRPRQVNIPNANDAVHMVSKLNYDEKFEAAMQHVFGKTIICPNLQVAAQYARSHGVSAITPDGDRADKKGALTGGYHDIRNSRIDAARREAKWRAEVESQEARREEIQRTLEAKDQEVTKAEGERRKIENKRKQMDDGYGPLRQELRNKGYETQQKRDGLESLEENRQNIESEERRLGEEQQAYQSELSSAFQKTLSSHEEQQLESLTSTIQELRKQLTKISTKRTELETKKVTLEMELREHLQPRLDQLNAQEFDNAGDLGTAGAGTPSNRLKEQQRELKRVNRSLEDVEKQLQQAEETIDRHNTELQHFEKEKADKQKQQQQLAKAIEQRQLDMTKNLNKKGTLTRRLAEVNRDIRDLGVLPDDAFDRYKKFSTEKIAKRLPKVREELKKFAHVNKKAFEQYNSFTKQKSELTNRRQDLDISADSIEKLIDHLDMKKDEAIERTFKQVSKEFANVFERLVPAGRGRLVIQRKSDQRVRDPDDSEEEIPRNSVENYTGVGITVSFNSKHDDQQRIQQLSGGQKTLCALALVFAIQQCDPAPFYLFDEIDANLDAQYRTAVAQMIKELSESGQQKEDGGGQFICTTFRPEMVLVAEKCYGVTYTNKTSSIDVVSREDAMDFVDGVTSGQQ